MKWYLKEFEGRRLDNIVGFLNELSDDGVKPECIKLIALSQTEVEIYYYHDKEIDY